LSNVHLKSVASTCTVCALGGIWTLWLPPPEEPHPAASDIMSSAADHTHVLAMTLCPHPSNCTLPVYQRLCGKRVTDFTLRFGFGATFGTEPVQDEEAAGHSTAASGRDKSLSFHNTSSRGVYGNPSEDATAGYVTLPRITLTPSARAEFLRTAASTPRFANCTA
jgi:hypothetical protein